MSDTYQLLQRIEQAEGRILQLELQLSISQIEIEELKNVSLSPEGPKPSGAVRVTENSFSGGEPVLDEPDDDDWLRRLAGLETAPEDDPYEIQSKDDDQSWPELD